MIDSHNWKEILWENEQFFIFLQTKHETNEFGPEAISKWPTNDLAFRAIRKKKAASSRPLFLVNPFACKAAT